MLILIFSVKFHDWGLPFLPSSGTTTPFSGGDLLDRLAHLVLPAVVLSFFYLAIWSRYTRSSMLEVLSQDYVRTARAKGMSERRVTYLHGLRNAVIPLVTLVGLELPGLVSGALVVEAVFSWPGIGLLAFQRALAYDYTMVLGIVTFAAVLVVLGNLVSDLLYAAVDPRIRLHDRSGRRGGDLELPEAASEGRPGRPAQSFLVRVLGGARRTGSGWRRASSSWCSPVIAVSARSWPSS